MPRLGEPFSSTLCRQAAVPDHMGITPAIAGSIPVLASRRRWRTTAPSDAAGAAGMIGMPFLRHCPTVVTIFAEIGSAIGGRDGANARDHLLRNCRSIQLQSILPTTAASRNSVSQACHRSSSRQQVIERGWRLLCRHLKGLEFENLQGLWTLVSRGNQPAGGSVQWNDRTEPPLRTVVATG